jgi:ribosomal protein L37AE/L43A
MNDDIKIGKAKKKEFLGVSIDADLKEQLEKVAEKENRKNSNMVCVMIKEGIKRRSKMIYVCKQCGKKHESESGLVPTMCICGCSYFEAEPTKKEND